MHALLNVVLYKSSSILQEEKEIIGVPYYESMPSKLQPFCDARCNYGTYQSTDFWEVAVSDLQVLLLHGENKIREVVTMHLRVLLPSV
jgi:hypothetical protein